MSYQLRMSAEIHDWLANLQQTDPSTAMQVGQALAALVSEGAGLGPPLVVSVTATWPEDLVAALDSSYQHRLDRLAVVRRRVAEAAWLAKDLQEQVDELESAQVRLADRRRRALEEDRKDDVEKAGRQQAVAEKDATLVRQLVPWITETEAWLRTRLQRQQAATDAFRTRKELLKATYTAARAELQVNEEIADSAEVDQDATGQDATGQDATPRAPGRWPGCATPSPRSNGNWAANPCRKACWSCGPVRPATARSASSSRSSRPAPRC